MNKIRIIDTTLRDGMHAVRHSFSPLDMERIAEGLDRAGADTIEVAHGDGLGGSSFQYGFSKYSEYELIKAVTRSVKNAKVAVLLIPGIGTCEELDVVKEFGVDMVRVAAHVTEADITQQHISYAKRIGLETAGFLMMSHMETPEKIVEQAKLIESYGADIVYCADSAGAMVPDDVKRRISSLKSHISLPVGFHSHNNLGLAIGNSLAAIESGADCIDTTIRGLGASAGNAPHEVLVAVMKKMKLTVDEDMNLLMDIAEDIVAPLMQQPLQIDKYALAIGYAGVYGSFFLHAKKAAEQFGVDARDILYELAKLKTVGGQEDMIVDVASKLSRNRSNK